MEKWYHVVSKENGEYFLAFLFLRHSLWRWQPFSLFNIQFTWNRWIEYYYKVVKVYLIFCVLYFDADRRYACLCDVLGNGFSTSETLSLCCYASVCVCDCVCVWVYSVVRMCVCVYTTVEIPSYFLHHIARISVIYFIMQKGGNNGYASSGRISSKSHLWQMHGRKKKEKKKKQFRRIVATTFDS